VPAPLDFARDERSQRPRSPLHTLYVSPLKALAVDVQRNLLTPIAEMGLDIRVETRTGDTPADRKARQRVRPPQILLTTPESLSLLLSHEDSFGLFGGLSTIVVDEIHAFAAGKRGDLLSLAMAGCSGSRRGCARSGCPPPCPTRKPIRAGLLRMRMPSWSTW
jgi:ATP-dependent Lhr-like helicase